MNAILTFFQNVLGFDRRLKCISQRDLRERFSEEEFEAIKNGWREAGEGSTTHQEIESFKRMLEAVWNPAPAFMPGARLKGQSPEEQSTRYQENRLYSPPAEPEVARTGDWLIGMTKEFRSNIDKIDRKLQGRILEAISDLCAAPTTPKGDTVKPLTHELKQLWRYRVGNYRIVYRPDENSRNVTLISFASRGSVYD